MIKSSRAGLPVVITGCAVMLLLLAAPAAGQGRLRPPESIKCDPNHLTSYTGRILSYQRGPGRVRLRMRTDEETTENFNLRFPRTTDAARWFLLNSQPFKRSDWKIIERSGSRLRPNVRATVWVCDDKSTPIIDWRPRDANTGSVY